MTVPAVQVPQLSAEQTARIQAAMEALGRQLAEAAEALWGAFADALKRRWEVVELAARGLAELFRRLGAAVRRVLAPLVRLADYRRERLRVMHAEYRRRLRHRRRRAR